MNDTFTRRPLWLVWLIGGSFNTPKHGSGWFPGVLNWARRPSCWFHFRGGRRWWVIGPGSLEMTSRAARRYRKAMQNDVQS